MSYRGSSSSLSAMSAAALAKAPTPLEQLLEEINFQRTKEMRQLLKDDSGFVMLQGTTYWTDLFVRHFLFQTDHCIDCDDLLFFVRKKHIKSSSRLLPKFDTEVDVFRKASRKLPIGDPDMDWEETVYLNLIIHQFDYTLTLAICTRTSPKELQVLKRHSQKVYASPSRRRMDTKAEVEEMTYPNVCFMVDNFNEVFCDIMVRDGEMVCVELVASDRDGAIQGVIFLGSIRYDALKRVYDARSSLSSKMAQRMTFGLFSNASSQRVEFVRMKGPQGKGHAEMAVTKPKGYSGAETPTSEPGYCATDLWDSDWDSDPEEFFVYRHQRRLSDPSANIQNFVRGGWKTKPADTAGSKARSENEGLDSLANGLNEIEAGDLRDDCEFCVHSITTDASTPLGTDHTVDHAVNSSAPVAKSSSKRITPASSIISSFFPSCKLKSKYPGQAIRCLSELNELACSTSDLVLSESAEGETTQKQLLSPTQKQLPHDQSNISENEDNKCSLDGSTQNVAKIEQEDMKQPDAKANKQDEKYEHCEERWSHSDEEFEDCLSSTSECSTVSAVSNPSVSHKSENESTEEVWSDADDGLMPSSSQNKSSFLSNTGISSNTNDNLIKDNITKFESFSFKNTPCTNNGISFSDAAYKQRTEPQRDSVCLDRSDSKSRHGIFNYSTRNYISDCSNAREETVYPKNVKSDKDVHKSICCHGIQANKLCLLCYNHTRPHIMLNHGSNPMHLHTAEEEHCDMEKNTYHSNILSGSLIRSNPCSTSHLQNVAKEVEKTKEECIPTPLLDGLCLHCHPSQKMKACPHSSSFGQRSKSSFKQSPDVTPPCKVASDGTCIYYWCDVPGGIKCEPQNELDDGAYNPLWTMRGFTQTFHFWKENKRAQSVPLNAFLTYITLPWWSIVRDILDHRESPILTF